MISDTEALRSVAITCAPRKPERFDEDFDIYLPAHTEQTITRICEFPQEINLIAMFGHFHSRGLSHEVFIYDPDTEQTGEQDQKQAAC